jgi:glycosyltransferase involved in cell wall biosynthesis
VVPSDPIALYEQSGYDWLERYFNPAGMFREVYAVSPLENGERKAFGMTILGVPEQQFRGVLRELKPDVVRAYGGYWPSDFVCRNRVAGVPVVVSVHDPSASEVHPSVRYADLVMCVSNAVERQVLAVGTDPSRTRLLPNRVDLRVFHPKAPGAYRSLDQRFPPGKHILHVGRRDPAKNIDTLIRAVALLPPDYSCIFVGRGKREPFVALADTLGVAERCFWLDSIQNSELPLWYSWCDCMCTPSRWEGFGIVFIEAAACGAAIVTSDIAPMNEYLTGDESACLVAAYENPGAVAEAIGKACENSSYRSRIKAGAVKVAQQFDLPRVDAMEVAIYREAMGLDSPGLPRRLEIAAWTYGTAVTSRLRSLREIAGC